MLKKYLNNILRPDSSVSALLSFLALLLVARIIMALMLPLFYDEAYYHIWSEQLQFGYYDHPPLIAWWIKAGHMLVGDGKLGIRLLTLLSNLVANSIGVYLLAREFAIAPNLARRSVVWTQSIWMVVLVGVISFPDAPTAFFWIFTCLCVARAARLDSTKWWIAAGLLAGLSCMSKYTGIFLAPGIFLWLISSPRYRSQLLRPGPWLAIVAALSIFAPNIVWNAQNDWGTFDKQFGRAIPKEFGIIKPLGFLLTQALYISPMILFFIIRGLWQSASMRIRSVPELDQQSGIASCMYFTACTSLPFLLYMLAHSFHSLVGVHWLTPLYPSLALLSSLSANNLVPDKCKQIMMLVPVSAIGILIASGAFLGYLFFGQFDGGVAWSVYVLSLLLAILAAYVFALMVSLLYDRDKRVITMLMVLILSLSVLAELLFLNDKRTHEPEIARNWQEMANNVKQRALQHDAKWIGTGIYQTNAMLYLYTDSPPIIGQLYERFRYTAKNSSWQIEHDNTGLVVEQKDRIMPQRLKKCFEQVKQLAPEYRANFTGYALEYDVYLVAEAKKNWVKEGC